MIRDERRWASPAAAVLAFCWTLVMLAPPTIQPTMPSIPASILADGAAAFAAHLFLGVLAVVGLYLAAKVMLHRPAVETNGIAQPASRVHAA